jgi:hypothetical protein
MKRKTSAPRSLRRQDQPARSLERRRNIPVDDLFLYARSFHQAARNLAGSLHVGGDPVSDVDFSPALNLYRLALELHLKALVLGEGGNFLATKPDPLSIYKTHSVSWLAQFASQIVTALKWEREFRCEGISNLDDFKAVVEELNVVDPGSYTYRCFVNSEARFDVADFCWNMDALLGLLDSTADALAAEWDLRSGAVPEFEPDDGGSFGQTIQ